MSDLTGLRTSLGMLIGSAIDAATWTPALLDEALRNGLRTYSERGPISETSFLVTTSGSQQDLGSIAQLYNIVGLAWPWSTNADFERLAVRWRLIDQQSVYLLDGVGASQRESKARLGGFARESHGGQYMRRLYSA